MSFRENGVRQGAASVHPEARRAVPHGVTLTGALVPEVGTVSRKDIVTLKEEA